MFFEADFSQSGVEGKQIKEIQQREQLTPELRVYLCSRVKIKLGGSSVVFVNKGEVPRLLYEFRS